MSGDGQVKRKSPLRSKLIFLLLIIGLIFIARFIFPFGIYGLAMLPFRGIPTTIIDGVKIEIGRGNSEESVSVGVNVTVTVPRNADYYLRCQALEETSDNTYTEIDRSNLGSNRIHLKKGEHKFTNILRNAGNDQRLVDKGRIVKCHVRQVSYGIEHNYIRQVYSSSPSQLFENTGSDGEHDIYTLRGNTPISTKDNGEPLYEVNALLDIAPCTPQSWEEYDSLFCSQDWISQLPNINDL